MNDELTPSERAALRARIVGGARDIRPAGAHRSAVVAGSIAAVLVVAIAGGVAVTTTLSAPPVATTPSPTASESHAPTLGPTPTTTPTMTPTPTPHTAAIAFGGDCANVLTDEHVSSIVGVPMTVSNGLPAADPRVIGGLSCQWRGDSDGFQAVGIAAFPVGVVPDAVRASLGQSSACAVDGLSCRSSERFGDAVVSAWGSTDEEVARMLAAVGERAASMPWSPRSLPEGAWTVPSCDQVLRSAGAVSGRTDLGPHQGDYFPWGLSWDVMTANGAEGFCSIDNLSSVGVASVVDIAIGPGSSPNLDEITRRGGVPVAVPGAAAAWYLHDFTSTSHLLVVTSGPNVLSVATQSMSEQEMNDVAAGVLSDLG